MVDASTSDTSSSDAGPSVSGCWTISTSNPVFHVSACVTPAGIIDTTDVSSNTSIDTDTGISTPLGLGCVPLLSGDVCALVAKSIVIRAGITLSAHGTKPLALLGHDIDVEGTIDVASHITGNPQAKGPAADRTDCNIPTPALVNGGGAGGTYDSQYTDGRDEGGDGGGAPSSTAGKAAGSTPVNLLLGGCAGGPSSADPPIGDSTVGSHGGGAVWIAADTGTLVIGSTATINASGAGGAGGKAVTSNRGGYGGGSGGLIVLQSPTITQSPNAKIFANGGGGGGGDGGANAGSSGSDPLGPLGGVGGNGARDNHNPAPDDQGGDGGQGFSIAPSKTNNGGPGMNTAGGGGGGGGTGAIRVLSNSVVMGANVSPPSIKLL